METLNVRSLYIKLINEGKDPKDAAREAQERTGFSLVTGRPIKKDLPYKKVYNGQYR
jgi:hypothetical protein